MRRCVLAVLPANGRPGGVVEADETYFGDVPEANRRNIDQRGNRPYTKGGKVGPATSARSFLLSSAAEGSLIPSAVADSATVAKIVSENVDRESRLHTDESRLYTKVGANFAAHETVIHSHGEYARGDVTTNTVETYFSVFKRGMRGIYQHCDEKHLHRYLAEYDFRYNTRTALGFNDGERAALAIKGVEGKRLTYRLPH